MTYLTVKAQKFRGKLRDYLDSLIADKDAYFVITRNRQETGVIISIDRWQRLQMLEGWAEAQRIKEDIDAGNAQTISWEALEHQAEVRYGMGS